MRHLITIGAACAMLFVASHGLQAQAKPAKKETDVERLHRLLRELRNTPASAWQTELQRLERVAKEQDLRAKAHAAEAARAAKRAKTARAEIARLRRLLAELPPAKAGKSSPRRNAAKPTRMAAKPKPKPKRKPTKKPTKKVKPTKPKRKPARVAAMPNTPSASLVTYDDHVQPIFMTNCSACHDSDERAGGLDLTTFANARAGGSSGRTIVPGDIERSRLYQLVAHLEKPTMPPDEAPIDKKQIDLIRRWIAGGAAEDKADALASSKKMRAERAARNKVVAKRPSFDRPAPMPNSWSKVSAATTRRGVRIKALAASPRSPLLAVPGKGQVFVYNSTSLAQIGILPFEHGDVEVLAFSRDASRLLVAGGVAGKRGRAVLYDVGSGEVVGTYGKSFDSVLAAAVHPQLTHVAIGGTDRRVQIYEVATGKLTCQVEEHGDWVLGVDISADGKHLVSVDRKGAVVVTELPSGRNLHTINRHRGAVNQVRFAPDGRSFATIGADRTLRMFRCTDGKQAWQRSTRAEALSVTFTTDGKWLACGCSDKRVRLFRNDGRPSVTLGPVGDWVYGVAVSPDNKRLFAGDWVGGTTVFDLKKRRPVTVLRPTKPRRVSKR